MRRPRGRVSGPTVCGLCRQQRPEPKTLSRKDSRRSLPRSTGERWPRRGRGAKPGRSQPGGREEVPRGASSGNWPQRWASGCSGRGVPGPREVRGAVVVRRRQPGHMLLSLLKTAASGTGTRNRSDPLSPGSLPVPRGVSSWGAGHHVGGTSSAAASQPRGPGREKGAGAPTAWGCRGQGSVPCCVRRAPWAPARHQKHSRPCLRCRRTRDPPHSAVCVPDPAGTPEGGGRKLGKTAGERLRSCRPLKTRELFMGQDCGSDTGPGGHLPGHLVHSSASQGPTPEGREGPASPGDPQALRHGCASPGTG